MADRELRMPTKKNISEGVAREIEKMPSQRRRPESSRYLLQIDRQTKGSFQTFEDAHLAALKIRKSYPIIQVAVHDRMDHVHTSVTVPPA
jgi:hypothetical protein